MAGCAVSGWEPGRWWRVVYRSAEDGKLRLWCETSNEQEARDALKTCPDGGLLQRSYERHETEWREAR